MHITDITKTVKTFSLQRAFFFMKTDLKFSNVFVNTCKSSKLGLIHVTANRLHEIGLLPFPLQPYYMYCLLNNVLLIG